MVLLTSVLNDESRKYPLIILQSSLAQSSLPLIRRIVAIPKGNPGRDLLFCLLYPPSSLIYGKLPDTLQVYDWTNRVPGYNDIDSPQELLAVVDEALDDPSTSPLNIIIDSVDTLLEDSGSVSETYKTLSKLYNSIKKHPNARLILHFQSSSSNLLSLVTQTTFSSSLSHVIAHPPALITHLATEFLMPPPPVSSEAKFWSVFLPVSERIHETESLVVGSSSGEGSGHPFEFVVELIVREGAGRKRGVERVLEGWSSDGPSELTTLESLKVLTTKLSESVPVNAPDPTQNLPFNLNLTSSQQESRAQVPLPYAHEGTIANNTQGAILYDPDSADDIDDDDPDEDLDI